MPNEMNRHPTVSVCIPSYNHARFLPASLDSVFAQTFRDFEVVVVDDGSTDNSLEILDDYAQKYPAMMRVFTHPGHRNLGTSASDNLAIEMARGIYWCTQDSDDICYPDQLKRLVEFFDSRPEAGWVYGVSDFIDQDGRPLEGQYGHDLSSCPDLVEDLIFNAVIAPQMVRMKCMKEVGPFEPGLVRGEWEYWIRLAARFPAAFMPRAVGAHRNHDSNTSISLPQHATRERIRQDVRWSLEVFTTLRRKSEANSRFFSPRTRALFDLKRAALHILIEERQEAQRAVAEAFQSDPALRRDAKHLTRCLRQVGSLRLLAMVSRELGYPPSWLWNADFLSTALRVGTNRILRRR